MKTKYPKINETILSGKISLHGRLIFEHHVPSDITFEHPRGVLSSKHVLIPRRLYNKMPAYAKERMAPGQAGCLVLVKGKLSTFTYKRDYDVIRARSIQVLEDK